MAFAEGGELGPIEELFELLGAVFGRESEECWGHGWSKAVRCGCK